MAKSAAGKARIGLYTVKGDELTRTHRSCPKCGPGIFLAEHAGRRSCGRCGYSEAPAPAPAVTAPTPTKGRSAKAAPAAAA